MLQAFVKMVGANVNVMEEHLAQAEGELGTIPSAFKKILRTMSVPGFLNVFPIITCPLSKMLPVCVWPRSPCFLIATAVFAVALPVVTLFLFTRRNHPAREDQCRTSVTRFQACSGQTITSRRSRSNDAQGHFL